MTGYPFVFSPAQFVTNIQLFNATSTIPIVGLSSGQTINITANVQYSVPNGGAQGGFNGPLDSAIKGGVVVATVGWGFYNTTSNTFGGENGTGGVIATVLLTYSNVSQVWSGTFNSGSLPIVPNATTYEVVVTSHDSASPPNTGFATLSVPLSASQRTNIAITSVSTATTVSVAVSTINHTITAVPMWNYNALVYTAIALVLIVGLVVGFQFKKSE